MTMVPSALRCAWLPALLAALVLPPLVPAQSPQANTGTVDDDGSVHVTRVIPLPQSLSPEAKASLKNRFSDKNQTLAERRIGTDRWQKGAGEASRKVYPVNIKDATIAGIPVLDVTPLTVAHPDWVLLCFHGGGFVSDSGSLTESIPLANLTKARVVSVLYRLAPEHPYPASLDDAVAVYRELLKTYRPQHIVIYGTSAGAILTAETAVRLKQLGVPLPAGLGIFSGMGDFTDGGESAAMFSLRGLTADAPMAEAKGEPSPYIGALDPKDPIISPVFADLHGMPPTLFITSGRDILLCGTTILHRKFLRAGADARLIDFEGLPHAFWNDVALPESREAYGYMADFFTQQLSK